jgi:hypothetical protein
MSDWVEAGPTEVVDIGSLSLEEPVVTEGPARKVEQTRSTLAYCLFGLLAAVLGVLLGLLAAGSLTTQEFDSAAGVVLAPIFALLGAATGYYYGKTER